MLTTYQCAAVNFVTGSNNTLGDACSNSSSSFTAEWTDGVSTEEDHSGHSESASATPTESAAETASADSAGAIKTLGMGSFIGGMGALAAGLLL